MPRLPGIGTGPNTASTILGSRAAAEEAKSRKARERAALLDMFLGVGDLGLKAAGIGMTGQIAKENRLEKALEASRAEAVAEKAAAKRFEGDVFLQGMRNDARGDPRAELVEGLRAQEGAERLDVAAEVGGFTPGQKRTTVAALEKAILSGEAVDSPELRGVEAIQDIIAQRQDPNVSEQFNLGTGEIVDVEGFRKLFGRGKPSDILGHAALAQKRGVLEEFIGALGADAIPEPTRPKGRSLDSSPLPATGMGAPLPLDTEESDRIWRRKMAEYELLQRLGSLGPLSGAATVTPEMFRALGYK